MKFRILPIFIFVVLIGGPWALKAQGQPAGGKGPVPIKISWSYKDVPATMKIYEVSAGKPTNLWDMGTGANLTDLPIGAEIPASTIQVAPGAKKKFVLVLQNTGKEKIHFFAAPHSVNPPEFSLGFNFKCLCINHVYNVEPGKYWYRVVELKMAPEYVGPGFDILHALIRVDEARSKMAPMRDSGMNHGM